MDASTAAGNPTASSLTKSQLLMWTGQQLHPSAPLYNMAFLFTIERGLDPSRFAHAWSQVAQEFDVLRLVIDAGDDMPRQRVQPDAIPELEVVDLRDHADPDAVALAWGQARCERPFDLGRRLTDVALLILGDDRAAWYLNQHHLVTDAGSLGLVFRRLSAVYDQLVDGASVPESGAPSFLEYVARERAVRDADAVPGAVAALPSPLYGRDGRTASTRNERVELDLGAQRTARLLELAARPEARALTAELGLFNLVATLVFAYVVRVSGNRVPVIATPTHLRPTPDLKATVGLFTEVLPLRVEIDPEDSFLTLRERVAMAMNGLLMSATPGAADPRRLRHANVVLNYLRAAFGDLGTFAGAPCRATWLHPGHADREHHLRLQVHDLDGDGRLRILFDFNADLFDAPARTEAVGHFERLLDAMLDDWTGRPGEVDLISAQERERQLVAFNRTGPPATNDDHVLRRFETEAHRSPETAAITEQGTTLTYAALDARADGVAARLQAAGVARGDVVAVCMPRTGEAVVAMLGIFKAGAAYVPVDPAWPDARRDLVIEDAGARIALVTLRHAVALPDHVTGIAIDDGTTSTTAPVRPPADPDDLAYVMYTSGSTGRPKGVMITHGALANYVAWARGHYLGNRGRLAFPLFTPLTFDLTVTSIFVPLASGGSIVVYPRADGRADLALLDVITDDAVDIIKLTPSHLSLLQHRDLAGSRVRQLILGGEDLATDVALRAWERFGRSVVIHNEYGPTEATVGCVVHTFDPTTDRDASVPIGRPIDGMQAYVLDEHRRPLPAGVVGELYVAGAGVARGYAGDPERTDERFVPSPFAPDTRLYRTGDLARFGPGDVLEYRGRVDEQVKIRGMRVELPEIEAAALGLPGVDACVVTMTDGDRAREHRIVYCARCGLASNYPDVTYDDEGVCNHCRTFDTYRARAHAYFGAMDEMQRIFGTTDRGSAPYDCIALLSGGKDSTYMLARLADMGLDILAFTLDNGYISDEAIANIRRVVEALGVDHEFATTPAMNEIFVDSLRRHANVCHGCFKTIYTLSMLRARELGVPFIVTGLSRGQFFETRLTADLFTDPDIDPDRIDATVLEARKAYHRVDDAVLRLLPVQPLQQEQIFDDVRFVDFYRYCDVGLDDMMSYLDRRLPWVRPTDTGRSTNCLINDVGIHVHKRERGFHNYALPYSWDVRMGHKSRGAALAELDDEIDVAEVQRILQEIGFEDDETSPDGGGRLVVYYTGADDLAEADLRAALAERLPDFMVPAHVVRLDTIPMTTNGKVDRAALPDPGHARPSVATPFLAPRDDAERALAAIWSDVLGLDRVGVHDDFFALGGDSISAIQIVARARRQGLALEARQLFDALTIEALARTVSPPAASAPTAEAELPAVDPGQLDKLAAALRKKDRRT